MRVAMHRPVRTLLPVLLCCLTACAAGKDLHSDLKTLALDGKSGAAKLRLELAREKADTESAYWLAAASWVGRSGVFGEDWEIAETYGTEAYDGSQALVKAHGVDGIPHLATAVGASIEVLSRVIDANADRPGAVAFLEEELGRYSGTSIEIRLRKNLLLLSLEGQPMPPLEADTWASDSRLSHDGLKGKVALFFFWAHWCETCARQKPVLAELREAYSEQDLQIVGPTRLYGYIEKGADAKPKDELRHIGTSYGPGGLPRWLAAPVNSKNFIDFGVSTTPTMVLVDQAGIVRMYQPGFVSGAELRERIDGLLASGSS